MGISTNAQRVVRIYRGSTKVWEDTSSNYIPIKLDSYVTGWLGIVIDPNNSKQGLLTGWVDDITLTSHVGNIQSSRSFSLTKSIKLLNSNSGAEDVTINISNNSIDSVGDQLRWTGYCAQPNNFGTIQIS